MKIMILIFLIVVSLFADDSIYLGDGATVMPITTDQIQMLQEKIIMTQKERFYIEMIAIYKNFGPDSTVLIGFPSEKILPDNYEKMLKLGPSKRRLYPDYFNQEFKTFIDGKSIPVKVIRTKENPELKEINYPTAYVFNVHFKQNEVKEIRHTYTAGGTRGSNHSWDFSYILKTGALWRDKINLIEIEMRIRHDMVLDIISPKEHSCRFNKDLNQIILNWEYADIEPDFDIYVNYLPYFARNATPNYQIYYCVNFINQYGNPGIRYLKNLIFAYYGYPFKHPLIRNNFYTSNLYSENENYSYNSISSIHKEFLEYLSLIYSETEDYSKKKLSAYKEKFPRMNSLNYVRIKSDSNIYLNNLEEWDMSLTLDRSIIKYDYYVDKFGKIGIRFLKNLVYAHYGYPFKEALNLETFYSTGWYSVNEKYSEEMISAKHREFLEKLSELEREYK